MRSWKFILPLLVSSLCFAAQPDRITSPIDSSQLVPLKGNVHGLVHPGSDLGRTDSAQALYGVTLVFHPSAAQQSDLDNLLAQQQQRSSPNYHKWLTPAQFADRFGMTRDDITRVSSWLESQGFTVTSVANSRNQISFDGTVAQVESVFATQIHNYLVDGAIYFANATNPSVPTALAPSVLAIGHLHNFSPKPRAIVRRLSPNAADPHFTSYVSGNHFLSPGDFATIYNVRPLYAAGFTGTNQTIAVVGQSTVSATDLANFRSAASLTPKAPTYILYPSNSTPTRCTGDEGESDLDLEWSNGVASSATVKFVYAGLVAGDTCGQNRTYSVWDALQQAIDNNYAPIISTSYGFCESGLGSSFVVTTLQGWAQQANAQGQTIMAASGDAGAADCDNTDAASATGGIAVDAPASLPEVTGMGGTEFSADSPTYTTNNPPGGNPPYWAPAGTNSDTLSSALEYIPGTAWNDTVANDGLLAAGGGASIYFSKPTWQTGTGVPADSKRDVPDLALNTSPDHDPYLFCSEDGPNNTIIATCTSGFRTGSGGVLSAVGGTSAAAPTFAAILALIEQDLATPSGLGNINPNLYYIAAGNPTALHDITTGNNIVPCTEGSLNCPSTAPFQYGFSAGTGYDQVTGLGSVNADALAIAWGELSTPTTTSVSASPTSVFEGNSVTFTATVTPATATGGVNFYNGSTTPIGSGALSSGTATFTTTSLPVGADSITATYVGINASSSSSVTVNVAAPFSMSANPPTLSLTAGQSQVVTITITPVNGYNQAVNFTNSPNSSTGSCSGMPAGVTCTFSSGSVLLNGSTPSMVQMTVATVANMAPATGANITVTGVSGSTSVPISIGLGVAATTETFTIATTSATVPVTAGGIASIPITVSGSNGFIVGSGSTATTQLPLSYTCTGFPSESTCTFSPSSGSSVSATTLTLSIATTAPVSQLSPPLGRGSRIFYALLLPGLLGIVFAGGSRTRTARLLGLIVVLGLSTLWMGACSGSSNSSQKNPGTPAGTYPVVVTATTGGANALTSTFTVQLAVSN
jgi:subtilase family serine protease